LRRQIGLHKQVPRKQGHSNHDFSIATFAPDGYFWQKNFYGFFSEAIIYDIFKSAFGMQHIPELGQSIVLHVFCPIVTRIPIRLKPNWALFVNGYLLIA
jgi:hypothetical protein